MSKLGASTDGNQSTDLDEDRFPASQFISADDVNNVDDLEIMKGILKKKSPKGLPGFKAWQQRYFILTPTKFKYFHDARCTKVLGAVPIGMIEKVDISKLEKECRIDLILHGESSRKFQLRALDKESANKWNVALSETIQLSGAEGESRNDMRKFSVKYWKEGEEKKKDDGPTPVERALAHLVEDKEIKQLHGIGKDTPELYLLTSALLHGLRHALNECYLKRKATLSFTKASGFSADVSRIQAYLELRNTPKSTLPAAVIASRYIDCTNGEVILDVNFNVTLPAMMDKRAAEVGIKFRTESNVEVGSAKISLLGLLGANGPQEFEANKGIKFEACGKLASESDKSPSSSNFNTELKYEYGKKRSKGVLEFPADTPTLKDGQFKYYAPKIFARLRAHFGIEHASFYESICNNTFVEFVSNSKSGAFFFFSQDGRYMIKTIEQGECKCLRQMLPKYYDHCKKSPLTLLCRFYGLFRLRCNKRTHYFIIMESVFYTPKYIHLILDLKGSTTNRNATEKDLKAKPTENFTGTILKDNDIRNSGLCVDVGEKHAKSIKVALDSDVKFLSSQGIIDYSLLVGIHYPDMPDPRDNDGKDPQQNDGKEENDGKNRPKKRRSSIIGMPISKDYQRQLTSLECVGRRGSSVSNLDEENRMEMSYQGQGPRKEVYFVGIIDVLIQFGIFKGGEYIYKSKLKGEGQKMSVVPPEAYGKRFLKFMNFFIKG